MTREEDWVGERGLGLLMRQHAGGDPVDVAGSALRILRIRVFERGAIIEWMLSPEPAMPVIDPDVGSSSVPTKGSGSLDRARHFTAMQIHGEADAVADEMSDENALMASFPDIDRLTPRERAEMHEGVRRAAWIRAFLGTPAVADDRGKRYRVGSWGQGGSEEGLTGEIRISPQPPLDALLTVRLAGAEVTVALLG